MGINPLEKLLKEEHRIEIEQMKGNKPLDLEKLADEITLEFFKCCSYEQTSIPQMRSSIRYILEQHIKSACEFYLQYKDNPRLFVKRFPELKKEVEKIVPIEPNEEEKRLVEKGIIPPKTMDLILRVKAALYRDEFNEWLFKFAFKDVFKK